MSNHTLPGKPSIPLAHCMKTDTISDSMFAVNDSKDRVLHALDQLLEQCDDDDAPALINQIRTKLACRYYALNAHQCRLLDLPPELLEKIGKFVLQSWPICPSKYWFTQGIFPLLQTCSQLRTQLQPLRSIPLTLYIRTDRPWSGEMRALVKDWRQKGFHKGPSRIFVTMISEQLKPSTAAALAGALECAIYGGLSNTPAVYIELNMAFGTTRREQRRKFYVCHSRAENMRMDSPFVDLEPDPSAPVSQEGGVEIWEQAKKMTRDEAP